MMLNKTMADSAVESLRRQLSATGFSLQFDTFTIKESAKKLHDIPNQIFETASEYSDELPRALTAYLARRELANRAADRLGASATREQLEEVRSVFLQLQGDIRKIEEQLSQARAAITLALSK